MICFEKQSIAIFAVFALFCIYSVKASTIINVPEDFGSIVDAIDIAQEDDIILVAPGEYDEDLKIEKSLSLKGSGADVTTIIGGITVENAVGVIIDGFNMKARDLNAHFGIWCSFSEMIISKNVIAGYHHGIGSESSILVIEDNSVWENFNVGIQVQTARKANIKGNIISDNIGTGLHISLSEDHVFVTDNVISGNRVGVNCVKSSPQIRRNIVENNKFGIQSTQGDGPDLGWEDGPGLNVIRNNSIHIMNMERGRFIQAKGNYWGNSSGPDIASFEGKVDYSQWLKTNPLIAQAVESFYKLFTAWGNIKELVHVGFKVKCPYGAAYDAAS